LNPKLWLASLRIFFGLLKPDGGEASETWRELSNTMILELEVNYPGFSPTRRSAKMGSRLGTSGQ
jgi:hypothetical protein